MFIGSNEKSSFLKAIKFFLADLATQELDTAETYFRVGQKGSLLSPREREQYNYSKCTIIVRLMEFASMVLVKCQMDFCKVNIQYFFCSLHILGDILIFMIHTITTKNNKSKISLIKMYIM